MHSKLENKLFIAESAGDVSIPDKAVTRIMAWNKMKNIKNMRKMLVMPVTQKLNTSRVVSM